MSATETDLRPIWVFAWQLDCCDGPTRTGAVLTLDLSPAAPMDPYLASILGADLAELAVHCDDAPWFAGSTTRVQRRLTGIRAVTSHGGDRRSPLTRSLPGTTQLVELASTADHRTLDGLLVGYLLRTEDLDEVA